MKKPSNRPGVSRLANADPCFKSPVRFLAFRLKGFIRWGGFLKSFGNAFEIASVLVVEIF